MGKRIYKKPSENSIKNHPLYNTWAQMKARCFNKKRDNYDSYGGRGITVCLRWKNSFADFLADVGVPPSATHTIDRKNVDGHYSCGTCDECLSENWPSNCCWATPSEQACNRRANRIVIAFGESKNMAEWARQFGLSVQAISYRLEIGMQPETALTKPLRVYKKSPQGISCSKN